MKAESKLSVGIFYPSGFARQFYSELDIGQFTNGEERGAKTSASV